MQCVSTPSFINRDTSGRKCFKRHNFKNINIIINILILKLQKCHELLYFRCPNRIQKNATPYYDFGH